MKLHLFPPSPNARKVMITAAHLGIDYEMQMVDLVGGDQHHADYAALNPNEKMPMLVDEGFVLWESNAIMQYLCSKAEDQTLWPSDAAGQADVARWQFWQACHWGPIVNTFLFERMVKKFFGDDSPPDEAKIAEAIDGAARFGAVLDAALARRGWLVGDSLTLADISIASDLTYAEQVQIPLDGFDNIAAWRGKIAQLPAWKATEPQK